MAQMPAILLADFRLDFIGNAVFFTMIAGIVAILALFPTFLALIIIHETRAPRGIAEVCAGAIIGPCVSLLLTLSRDNGFDSYGSLISGLTPFAIAGAVGGLTYWLVVGCPRHPKAN